MTLVNPIAEFGPHPFRRDAGEERLVPRYDDKPSHVECPCCHGSGHLTCHDEARGWTSLVLCTHCMGRGEVLLET